MSLRKRDTFHHWVLRHISISLSEYIIYCNCKLKNKKCRRGRHCFIACGVLYVPSPNVVFWNADILRNVLLYVSSSVLPTFTFTDITVYDIDDGHYCTNYEYHTNNIKYVV